MVEPNRENVFLNAAVVEVLATAIGQNYQIKMHADRYHFAYLGEIGRIFGPVYWTAEQHHASYPGARLVGQHRDAASVAVSKQVQTVEIVRLHPVVEISAGQCTRRIAVTARP